MFVIGIGALPLSAQSGRVNPFAMDLLEAHNKAREEVGVPRLSWSNRLAREAHEWAQHLASQGRMIHADREQRGGAGENLWTGHAGYYSAETMIGGFVAERRHFRHGTFPQVSITGNWRDVGHYTQVVWGGTREVGCAVARGETNDFLVCRYWPAGNIYNQRVF
ncbi:CAP domain-containing protein [Aurantiacibacter poecillastricola]|uniref:CAP domain-containing protein n=1 Tax=Aurantiacibacter poecillastricola TaxID=3064385 RepID=UPI00273E70BC|nr:CAP domain-containing protein [Aurantiacibacter sp. 219JJ12-13]MDP5262025.1 CAP domain-containing protein [Aurantiacibacter sp. 219JJ12-13]